MLAFNITATLSRCSPSTYLNTKKTLWNARPVRLICRASADSPLTNSNKNTARSATTTPSQNSHRAPPTQLVFEMSRVVILAGAVLGCIFLVDVIFGIIALSLAVVYAVAVLLGVRDAEHWPRRIVSRLSIQKTRLKLYVRALLRRWRRK